MNEEIIYNTKNNRPPKNNIPEDSYYYLNDNLLFKRKKGKWVNTKEGKVEL